jgi:hypothetical protein
MTLSMLTLGNQVFLFAAPLLYQGCHWQVERAALKT